MRKFIVIVTSVLIVLVLAGGWFFWRTSTRPASQHVAAHSSQPKYYYSTQRLRDLAHLAEQGNSDAAYDLATYYLFYANPRTPESQSMGEKWLGVAAERGNPEAMIGVANRIQRLGGVENCKKAIALLTKAVETAKGKQTIASANDSLADVRQRQECRDLH